MAGKSRVSRAPRAGKDRSDPGPVNSKADLRENVNKGAGPTAIGGNTPVPSRGRNQSSVRSEPGRAGLRDMTGTGTIFDRADAGNRRLGGRNR